VLAQPSGSRPEMRDLFYDNNMKGWGPELVKQRPDITRISTGVRQLRTKSRVTVNTKSGLVRYHFWSGIFPPAPSGLMDHLRIDKFMVLGFCIGGPMIWNLLKRQPDRIVG
jgi:hypothetical protein